MYIKTASGCFACVIYGDFADFLSLWMEELVSAVLPFSVDLVYEMKCNAIYAIINATWYLFKK